MDDKPVMNDSYYRLLFEAMQQGVVCQDAEGVIISMNPAAVRILGKTPEELRGETSADLEHESIREEGAPFSGMEQLARMALQTGREVSNAEMRVYNPRERDHRWINIDAVPLFRKGEEKPFLVCTLIDDITDRKAAETRLIRLASFPERNPHPSVEVDLASGEVVYMNPAARRLFPDMEMHPATHPFLAGMQAAVKPLQSEPSVPFQREVTIDSACYLQTISSVPGSGYVRVYSVDITLRKRAEEALRESEQRYRRLFEDDLTGDYLITPQGEIIVCNPAFVQIFKYESVEQATGASIRSLFPSHDDWNEYISLLKNHKKLEYHDFIRRRMDGQIISVVENVIGRFDEKGELLEIKGYLFDNTEQKKAEKLLRESEERFYSLFEYSPIPIMEEDFSEIKQYFNSLQPKEIHSFRSYLKSNPDAITHLLSLRKIVNANRECMHFFKAVTREEVFDCINNKYDCINNK